MQSPAGKCLTVNTGNSDSEDDEVCPSPLVDEDKLAVDGVAGDVLGGFDADVPIQWLKDDVGVQAPDGHQAAQVAALVVRFVVLVQAHLGRRPALEVTGAVDGAEALPVGCEEKSDTFSPREYKIFPDRKL